MPRIKRLKSNETHWSLIDEVSGAKYDKCQIVNYSELPFYKHEIETETLLFVFSIDNSDGKTYKIGSFNARPLDEDWGWLKWEHKRAAFQEALPLLKLFLNFLFETESNSAEITIENNVEIKTFKEEQLEAIELYLTGHVHFEILTAGMLFKLFDVDSIPAVKKEALRRIEANIALPKETESIHLGFFDMDEWIEESQQQSFRENLEDLREHWLTPNAPIDKIYNEIIEQYLSGGQKLPDQNTYAKKHMTDILPYLISES